MQLHEIKPTIKRKNKKRVGRGGKRGTYSGKGLKGQKSRAGAGIKPGFRGGDTPLWKKFPKARGASKKLEIKKPGFQVHHPKPEIVNLRDLNKRFSEGEVVSPRSLMEKRLVKKIKHGVKILGKGELRKKLIFKGVAMSKSAKERIARL
ncbi:MAG: large subunit ribosomal protein L15 [Parcubacteria group bacterium Gr01-1014_2]|nr:MAG: large subunit ribosomal protein L15 [Parcubacteria group bacterium Gr01-1014_2]